MPNIERMTVVLTEPMASRIRAAVEAGEYASTSEAMRDAVRLWEENRTRRDHELAVLRSAWEAGKASGSAGSLNMADIIAEAKAEKDAEESGSRG